MKNNLVGLWNTFTTSYDWNIGKFWIGWIFDNNNDADGIINLFELKTAEVLGGQVVVIDPNSPEALRDLMAYNRSEDCHCIIVDPAWNHQYHFNPTRWRNALDNFLSGLTNNLHSSWTCGVIMILRPEHKAFVRDNFPDLYGKSAFVIEV